MTATAPADMPGARSDLICPDCGSLMRLNWSGRYQRWFYGCTAFPRCHATHGAHPDGRPLGKPADAATKAARVRAHAAFDPLWQEHHMRRGQAYAWLARAMSLPEAHMGEFDIEQCELAIALSQAKLMSIRSVSQEMRELREQVRDALRLFGRKRSEEARDWAAKAIGLHAWPGTDSLTVEQLRQVHARCIERAKQPQRFAPARPASQQQIAERARKVLKRLSLDEIAVLHGFQAGPRLPTKAERRLVPRLVDLVLLTRVKDHDDNVIAYELTQLGWQCLIEDSKIAF